MTSPDMVILYSTFPDQQTAEKTAAMIVELKLAACANIFGGMRAIYEWKGEMQNDDEVAVIFKTSMALQGELVDKLAALHPYEIPAIIGFDASYVEAQFYAWLQGQLKS